ncbi:GEVED domain-containing protein [Taibaiella soli]|uniref:MAM domain-containing protein n=1 Tax=Taibaiella soli TaxID=1649169 RepID=A0A2W2ACJ8_9BACT|nr:GEVED domain-containing protein [Taibaiella soli]PZF73155.1 hypothetical protein DN068_09800 [Taibaiella soli]
MIPSVQPGGKPAAESYRRVKLGLLSFLMLLMLPFVQPVKAQTIQIGTGTSVTGTSSVSPVNIYYRYMHVQYLFTAAEINALGITGPQIIDSLGFNVIGAPIYQLPDFSLKMAGTSMTSLLASQYTGTFTTVYTDTGYAPVANTWNMIGFQNSFAWNGVDNIVIEVCYGQVMPTYNSSGTVEYTTNANVMGKSYTSDGTMACGQVPTANQYNRPNTKLHFSNYPACTGAPSITSQTASPMNSCASATQTLFVNVANANGYTFQWEKAAAAGGPWTPIAGATGMTYTFSVTGNAYYHVVVTCTASGNATTGSDIQVISTPPTYANLPYVQDFENWQNYCDTLDVPSGNWTNQPSRGNTSWRRNDQGATAAGWYSPASGMYSPTAYSGSYSACFNTYGTQNGTPALTTPGNLDLYVNCSATTGPKELYFYYINKYNSYKGDTLSVLVSTDGGATFSLVSTFDTATSWIQKMVPIASNAAQTVIRFSAKRTITDLSNIGIDSVYIAEPCNGLPTAGVITPAGPLASCPGYSTILTATGTSLAGNLSYQWIQKANGATTWTNAVGGSGATTTIYTTPVLNDTIEYRMVVTCLGGNLRDTTPVMVIDVDRPRYASIPFVEDFESWGTRCYPTDIPSPYWSTNPSTGTQSWRRHDQGASANWNSPTSYLYSPAAQHGSYSARFHSGWSSAGTTGTMDLFVDCSTMLGNKELQFYYVNASGSDSLKIQLSTDGGATFTPLAAYSVATSWTMYAVPVASNSAQTVIRFIARADYGSTDIGLDYVRVLPPCAGNPVAGNIEPTTPCANTDFQIGLQNNSQSAGLSYQWQMSTNGTTWTSAGLTNATQMIPTANISAATYFRCIVTCTNSNLADTTPAYLAKIAPFYMCYCASTATGDSYSDIGNVTITNNNNTDSLLNNGVATPVNNNPAAINLYTDFRTSVVPTVLYRDSTYNMTVSQINVTTFLGSTVATYIDYDGNGVFDPSEQLFKLVTSSATPYVVSPYTIPSNAKIGVTGMRVIMVYGTSATINPCGTYTYGETEDYLVDLRYPPCDGPSNPGIAKTSDTSMCIGYYFQLTDTTHEKYRSSISWKWQQSNSFGSQWIDVAGSANRDTLTQMFNGTTWYRLQMICDITHDTTYSNIIKINEKPPYKCYCYSIATGGAADTSDIGAFSIGNFVVTIGGPHIMNPLATKGRGDFTDLGPIELYVDSTYAVDLYHILRGKVHADARVTMFMDFNNNLTYDIPDERVVLTSDVSSANGWYVINNITIPKTVIPNVPTGMRVILNNNVGPNIPSDEACGPYTSGETADFTVIFRQANPTGVGSIGKLQQLALYPNPNEGQFRLSFKSQNAIRDLQIAVTNVAGQQLLKENFSNAGTTFTRDFDLSQQARGVYFVEIKADGVRTIEKVVIR